MTAKSVLITLVKRLFFDCKMFGFQALAIWQCPTQLAAMYLTFLWALEYPGACRPWWLITAQWYVYSLRMLPTRSAEAARESDFLTHRNSCAHSKLTAEN